MYDGPLDENKTTGETKRALKSYYCQRRRCYNSGDKRYKHYGGKGIKVKYTTREFISWWLEQIKTRKYWKCATVSRINHDKNYEFNNIKLEEKSENSKEVWNRIIPNARKPVNIFKNKKFIKRLKSVTDAARFINGDISDITKVCRGTRKTSRGYYFEFAK
ncbi:MAG: hypothetical protein ACW991_02885 [Candidatus Hodarchaeales archaeon]|jgi:hypothetical protein